MSIIDTILLRNFTDHFWNSYLTYQKVDHLVTNETRLSLLDLETLLFLLFLLTIKVKGPCS